MRYAKRIKESEARIKRLHEAIHETYAKRHLGEEEYARWQQACETFHREYPGLSWIDPKKHYLDSIRSGDKEAIEYGLQFIEIRPYFFRSGYMYKDLIRILRGADLTPSQRERYDKVRGRYEQFKKARKAAKHQQ